MAAITVTRIKTRLAELCRPAAGVDLDIEGLHAIEDAAFEVSVRRPRRAMLEAAADATTGGTIVLDPGTGDWKETGVVVGVYPDTDPGTEPLRNNTWKATLMANGTTVIVLDEPVAPGADVRIEADLPWTIDANTDSTDLTSVAYVATLYLAAARILESAAAVAAQARGLTVASESYDQPSSPLTDLARRYREMGNHYLTGPAFVAGDESEALP